MAGAVAPISRRPGSRWRLRLRFRCPISRRRRAFRRTSGWFRAGRRRSRRRLSELAVAVTGHMLVGETPTAVRLANEALALARQIGAPALVATGLLAVGLAVADTDPEQARACLRESRELSTALAYH